MRQQGKTARWRGDREFGIAQVIRPVRRWNPTLLLSEVERVELAELASDPCQLVVLLLSSLGIRIKIGLISTLQQPIN